MNLLCKKKEKWQSLRKFSNLDYKHLLLHIKKKKVDRCKTISLMNCSYTTEDAIQIEK